jgi:Skp family chaperone for outer membrane proteins
MRNVLRNLLPGVLLLSLLGSSAWAQGRIATVDLAKVFEKYWKWDQAKAVLKERQADMEKEFKNMGADFNRAKDEYQRDLAASNDQAVSQEERDKRKRSAEDKLKYLRDQEDTMRQYRVQATATLEEQGRRMSENILGEIRTIVNARAKTAGYAMVVDTAAESAKGTPIVLFNTGENDITEAVVSQLNSTAPADATKADGKKDEKKDEKKDAKKETPK